MMRQSIAALCCVAATMTCAAAASDHWKMMSACSGHSPSEGRKIKLKLTSHWLDEYELVVSGEKSKLEKIVWHVHGKNEPVMEINEADSLPGLECPQDLDEDDRQALSARNSEFLESVHQGFRYLHARAFLHGEDDLHDVYIVPVRMDSTLKTRLYFLFEDADGHRHIEPEHAGVAHGDPD